MFRDGSTLVKIPHQYVKMPTVTASVHKSFSCLSPLNAYFYLVAPSYRPLERPRYLTWKVLLNENRAR